MKPFFTLVFQIGLSLCFVLAGMHAAAAWMREPPQYRLDMTAQTLWTAKPVRIDRSRQNYERLPAPIDPWPLKFRGDRSVRIIDSATFERQGQRYRLAGAPVVARAEVCKDDQGRRTACGLKAFKALDNALRGKFVECRVDAGDEAVSTTRCRVNGQDLAELL